MILVTVGMQLGFDRLIEAMDALIPELSVPAIAQIGPGEYAPQNMETRSSIPPAEFERLAREAKLIVSHAGIGTVLTAQRCQTPILLFPRSAKLGEHRNNHQIATAEQLRGRNGILIANNATELREKISQGLQMIVEETETPKARKNLEKAISSFIENGTIPPC